jgi:hypothetical protein
MARISEIHYSDTIAADPATPEFVEIALSPAEFGNGTGLGRFEVGYYTQGGVHAMTVALDDPSFTTPGGSARYANPTSDLPNPAGIDLQDSLIWYDSDANEYVFVIDSGVIGMRYSVPDNASQSLAVALVDDGTVLEFLDLSSGSNENAAITAVGGPAAGETATKIDVDAPAGTSAQWNRPAVGTPEEGALTPGDSGIICFAAGTRIATPDGPLPVERLRPGDLVLTRDRGPQPIRWAGGRTLTARQLAANPALRPIRIAAGALGPGTPERNLLVSPQHRILIRSKRAARRLGAWEVLVPAKKLLGLPGVAVAPEVAPVTYHHLLLDRHDILFANGAPAESLYPGPMALRVLGPAAAAEPIALFPALTLPGYTPRPARPQAMTLP